MNLKQVIDRICHFLLIHQIDFQAVPQARPHRDLYEISSQKYQEMTRKNARCLRNIVKTLNDIN